VLYLAEDILSALYEKRSDSEGWARRKGYEMGEGRTGDGKEHGGKKGLQGNEGSMNIKEKNRL
jgi:hypothetical protein